MQPGDAPAAPPGWYGDPWGLATHRWWDGTQWTGHVAPALSAAPAPGNPWLHAGAPGWASPWAYTHDGPTQRMVTWAKAAFVAFAMTIAAAPLVAWPELTWVRHIFDAFRDYSGPGTPTLPQPPASLAANSVLGALEIGALVLIVLWQAKATDMARALGFPAVRSTGWGIAGWFVPVIRWWFPYQAVRDCLAPGDPERATVKRMWTCYLVSLGASLITMILALAGTPVGWATGVLTAVAAAGFAALGVRVVTVIDEAHRRTLWPEATVVTSPDPAGAQ